ncbi:hypothetical protein ACFFUP_18190 [Vibrio ostreicida]|uniref:Alpha/beta hydrolase n=1 Tax=Vibrio ostreicida TaxID=526588 RepID=A0ABT8BWX9_9VIBR|nr:hypothetical protein [Vibrio ostreicida]MDN3611322.1 hypothetical protein [Vibrio ostreicida]NPD09263.1 hypothetical protein [Vibrio ostreicida]
MANKLGIVTLHGMGNQPTDYYKPLMSRIEQRLGRGRGEMLVKPVYYHQAMQANQESLWQRMSSAHDLDAVRVRQFMLHSFSDAVNIQDYREPDSIGLRVSRCVHEQINAVTKALDDDGVFVVVAQSLGNQVMSNYIWDIQHERGLFAPGGENVEAAMANLSKLRVWFSTGNNMPLFVSGLEQDKIHAIQRPNRDFEWWNFFDVDDALGWPLKPLNEQYHDRLSVRDLEVNTGFTLLSHNHYWKDADVLDPLCDTLMHILNDE